MKKVHLVWWHVTAGCPATVFAVYEDQSSARAECDRLALSGFRAWVQPMGLFEY